MFKLSKVDNRYITICAQSSGLAFLRSIIACRTTVVQVHTQLKLIKMAVRFREIYYKKISDLKWFVSTFFFWCVAELSLY